jgi:hypothetical protein
MPLSIYHNPRLQRHPFTCWCPVSSAIIIHSQFLPKSNNSPALLEEGLLRRPIVCCHLWTDCQHSLCFLLVKPPVIPLATFADMPRKVSDPVSGFEGPRLVNWSALSFPSIPMCPDTHISWIMLCSAILPENDGNPRTIYNLSENSQTSILSNGNDMLISYK